MEKPIMYFGLQCLWTIPELEENAVANFGEMDKDSYENFKQRMNIVAQKQNIAKPQMAIGIKFQEYAHPVFREYICLITEHDWDEFEGDAESLYEYMPKVFVIDGSKFKIVS